MGHIFISYSRKDEEYVNKLVVALENEGFEVWIDRELLTGDTWIQVINHKIDTCDAFVIVMTDASKGSRWVQREVLYAIQEGKKIFPLLLQGKLWMLLQDFNFFKVIDGSVPEKKFFKDIEKIVLRSDTWLVAQREAFEKASQKLAEEERQRIAQEKAERESAEKIVREKAKREAAERIAREEVKHKAAEKAKQEKLARQADRKAAIAKTLNQFVFTLKSAIPKGKLFFRIVGVLGIIIIIFGGGSLAIPEFIALIPTAQASAIPPTNATLAFTKTSISPTKTTEPNSTPTKIRTPQPTSLPTEITDAKGVSMALVPSGEFTMGSNNGNLDEKPVHVVYLDAFYIDKYEVSISLYKACVAAEVCNLPTEYLLYYNSGFSHYWTTYPVTNVTWYDAVTYCNWRSARLPTEAEWEKSARSTDQRTYPWGEDEPKPSYVDNNGIYISGDGYANFGAAFPADGNFEEGKSPYGIYHLAGNVWEWVADRYANDYYSFSEYKNPQGPANGSKYVIRGGSYIDKDSFVLRTTYRYKFEPTQVKITIGFRCAMDAP